MRVSVIIPVYNREKYIIQAIESCLIQPEVGQVIVVDDGSTDNTLNLISKIKDDRVCLCALAVNSGASFARNEGLKHVNSELVSFLDSDDYYLPGRFKEPIEILLKQKDIHGTYEQVKNFNDSGIALENDRQEVIIELEGNIEPASIFEIVSRGNVPFFHLISMVIKKEMVKNVFFDTQLKFAEDKDFIYQILRKAKLKSINKNHIYIYRRLHESNLTNSNKDEILSYTYIFIEKWFLLIQKENFSKKQTWNILYRKISLDYINNINSNSLVIKLIGKFLILLGHIIKKPILIKKLLF